MRARPAKREHQLEAAVLDEDPVLDVDEHEGAEQADHVEDVAGDRSEDAEDQRGSAEHLPQR